MNMSWQYIAGFFDGEGSIIRSGVSGYRLIISQTNWLVLETIRLFVGCGIIFEVTKRKAHWKDAWIFTVADQENVYRLLLNFSEFLIVKQDLAKEAMGNLKQYLKNKKTVDSNRTTKHIMAMNMRLVGKSFREIGSKISMDYSYVRRMLKKKGII